MKVYIDGSLVHTGTSWENYYRYDSESAAEQSPRIVRTMIFRTGGAAVPANAGKGFLIDNLTLQSVLTPPAMPTNFTGTATKGYVSGAQSMTLNWQDNASNETRYEIRYAKLYGVGVKYAILPANSTTFTLNGLNYRDYYTFWVQACNSAGCSGYAGPINLIIVAP